MKQTSVLAVIVFYLVSIVSCSVVGDRELNSLVCSANWYTYVEDQILTGDNHGHGPDLGSTEWRSVIEFKLGIRGDGRGDKNRPALESDQWCKYIDDNYITH